MICVGGNIRTKSCKFGEIRAKIFRNPKNLSAPTPMVVIATWLRLQWAVPHDIAEAAVQISQPVCLSV